jgi:Tol biopolymer transport system component
VTRPLAAAGGLVIALGLGSCQGLALAPAELPDAPIAFHWRDPETARRHAELLAAREPAGPPGGAEGVARVDEIAGYLKRIAGLEEGPREEETSGRLALLDPRTGRVTPVEAARRDAYPVAWAEPGRRLIFSQFDGDLRQLYEVDLERGEVHRLTRGPQAHARGCLLPDGRLVASAAGSEPDARGEPRVVSRIVAAHGGRADPAALSEGPADHSPACAPDGRAGVWVRRGQRGRESIVSRSPPDAAPRMLGPGREPSFSHDGRWLVYAAPVQRHFRLFRVRPDGSGRAPVGESALEEHQPAFSPDGRLVAYVAHDGHRRRLHVRRVDGSGDRILFADGDAESPVW